MAKAGKGLPCTIAHGCADVLFSPHVTERQLFNDITSNAIHSSLDALSMRQRVIADNIANINTPGFLARRVRFEESLSAALATGSGNATASVGYSVEPTRMNGNNVNLDYLTVANVDTGLRYSLMVRAMDGKFKSISAAMRTQ